MQWDGICEMRKKGNCAGDAPVDSLGCNHLHDKDEKDQKTKRFQTLVSIILSSQTQDPQVAIGMVI
jgi:endonuclease III